MPALHLTQKLQQTVRETPVVNGFSYAFLRLVVDEVAGYIHRKCEDELWTDLEERDKRVELTELGCSLIGSIWSQLGHSTSMDERLTFKRPELDNLLAVAIKFLAIFEDGSTGQNLNVRG